MLHRDGLRREDRRSGRLPKRSPRPRRPKRAPSRDKGGERQFPSPVLYVIIEIGGDPGCPEAVVAELCCYAGRRGAPPDHRIGVRLPIQASWINAISAFSDHLRHRDANVAPNRAAGQTPFTRGKLFDEREYRAQSRIFGRAEPLEQNHLGGDHLCAVLSHARDCGFLALCPPRADGVAGEEHLPGAQNGIRRLPTAC
jgi:hypothetical protein